MKRFEIFKTKPDEETETQKRILRIINNHVIEAEIPKISRTLQKELHKEKYLNSKGETNKYKESRDDICLSFGIPNDDSHVFIAPENRMIQRAFRAFVVFIDRKTINPETGLCEAFYGEGRTAHHILIKWVLDKVNEYGIKDATMESYIAETEKVSPNFTLADLPNDPDITHGPRWLFFKGFLAANDEEFSHLPGSEQEKLKDLFATRNKLEEHLSDEKGEIPTDTLRWFLTGSNVPSPVRPSEDSSK
jgi:hypothetical protein